MHYQANMAAAGAPEEVFAADTLNIVRKDSSYRLAFSMSKLYGTGARALVEVVMSDLAAKAFADSLEQLSNKEGEAAPLLALEQEPENSVGLVANFARISTNELATVLDFYFVSPLSMEQAAKSQTIHYKDVVRISTVPAIFYAVVQYFVSQRHA